MKLRNVPSADSAPEESKSESSNPSPALTATSWSAIHENGVWKTEDPFISSSAEMLSACYERLEKAREDVAAAEKAMVEITETLRFNGDRNLIIECGDYEVTVKDQKVLKWDTETLETIFHAHDKLPVHVKKSLTIDQRVYERLDENTKELLRPALTINNRKPKLNVRRK